MKPLHWYDHLSINLFWLGLNIRNTAIGNVFMPYLVALFVQPDIKNTRLADMNTAGLIIAMLVQPAIGLISDRSTSRFGRRRPFIFVGVLFDLVFLAAIGLARNYSILLVVILMQQFSANVSHGPLQGLIPDLVPEKERDLASAIKSIFELLPIVLVPATIGYLVGHKQVSWGLFVTGAALLLTMLLTVWLVKEKPLETKPQIPFWPPMIRVLGMLAGILAGGLAGILGGGLVGLVVFLLRGGKLQQLTWPLRPDVNLAWGIGIGVVIAMGVAVVIGVWSGAFATLGRDARRQTPFTWWIVNRLMFLAAITSIQKFTPYFLMYSFKLTIEDAILLNNKLMYVIGGLTLGAALLAGWFTNWLGRKRTIAGSGLLAALGTSILLTTIWLPKLGTMYIAGGILGIAAGLFMTTNWALGTHLAPTEEAGRYLGISNLAGAGAGMIGTGFGGRVADYINGVTPGLGYFAIFASYGVLFLLSTASLLKIKK